MPKLTFETPFNFNRNIIYFLSLSLYKSSKIIHRTCGKGKNVSNSKVFHFLPPKNKLNIYDIVFESGVIEWAEFHEKTKYNSRDKHYYSEIIRDLDRLREASNGIMKSILK